MCRQKENLKEDLSHEFYKTFPFVSSSKLPLNNKRTLCRRFDLCQMLRDMLSTGKETNLIVSHLPKASDEYNELKRVVYSKGLEENASILNVYKVRRLDESSNFNRQVFILK